MGFWKTSLYTAGTFAIGTMSLLAQDFSLLDAGNDGMLIAQSSSSAETSPAPQSAETPSPAPKNVRVGTVSSAPKATPSQNVTINLIHRLVERGVLTQNDADELIKQAEEDAAAARAMAIKQAKPPPAGANEVAAQIFAEPTPIPQVTSRTSAQPPSSPPEPNPPAEADDAVSVTYVPEIVKEQLREEIRQEVMEQARSENWANPRVFRPGCCDSLRSWICAFVMKESFSHQATTTPERFQISTPSTPARRLM